MIIEKALTKKLENLIKENKIKEALYFLLEKYDILKNNKSLKHVYNYLETSKKENSLMFSSTYFFLLETFLDYLLTKNKTKLIENLLKIDISLAIKNDELKFLLSKIYSICIQKEDLEIFLDKVFKLCDDEELQKVKYFHLLLLLSLDRFLERNIWIKHKEKIKDHIDKLIQKEKEDLLLVFNTIMNHILMNLSQTQNEFDEICELLDKPLSNYIEKKYKSQNKRNFLKIEKKRKNKKSKLKLAFIVDKLVNNSPTQVIFSFLKNLLEFYKDKLDIYILDANLIEKVPSRVEVIELFKAIGVKYVNLRERIKNKDMYYNDPIKYSRKLIAEEAYNFIQKENIDILIFGNSLYLSIYLAARKVSPIQIYWSHGHANWDVSGIDVRISHFPQNSKYVYFIFEEPRLKEFYIGPNPKLEKEIAKRIRKSLEQKYGKDIVILGTIGRFIKLQSEEYIKLICEVMKKHKNIIYLACGYNCDIVKKLVLKYGGEEVLSRWIFPGQVNPHIYGWVIDIWPDTFPLRQGKSKEEFEFKGKPYISYDSNFSHPKNITNDNFTKIFLKKYSVQDRIFFSQKIYEPNVNNLKEYKQKLENLIKNKIYFKNYTKLRKMYATIKLSSEYRKLVIKDFYKFIKNILKSGG